MPRGEGNTEESEKRMEEGRKKGGEHSHEGRGQEQSREFYQEIGKKGGEARSKERKKED